MHMNRCSLRRKPPSCTAAGTASNGKYPSHAYREIEKTTSYPSSFGADYSCLGIFSFEQMMISCQVWRARRQVQGQGKMGFSMYLPQAKEHRLSLWPRDSPEAIVTRRWSTFIAFILCLQIAVQAANKQVEVIHQQMDADNEVIRVWKRRKATNLDLLKDDEYAEAVSGRKRAL